MFKRAFMYALTAPVPESQQSDADEPRETKETAAHEEKIFKKSLSKRRHVEPPVEDADDQNTGSDDAMVQWMPGGKVAKCRLCPNKAMLNQDAVKKHLDSKAHKKAVRREIADKERADEIRSAFLKRMEDLEKKTMNLV